MLVEGSGDVEWVVEELFPLLVINANSNHVTLLAILGSSWTI